MQSNPCLAFRGTTAKTVEAENGIVKILSIAIVVI
jgi:hypothetical protein